MTFDQPEERRTSQRRWGVLSRNFLKVTKIQTNNYRTCQVFLRKYVLSSTRAAHYETCPIKGPTQLEQQHFRGAGRSRRMQFECL
jgi:hypothetical protein